MDRSSPHFAEVTVLRLGRLRRIANLVVWNIDRLATEECAVSGECIHRNCQLDVGDDLTKSNNRKLTCGAGAAPLYGPPSGSSVHISGSSVRIPGSSVRIPGSSVHIPGSSVRIPGSSVRISGSSVRISGSSVRISGASVHIPGASVHISGSSVRIPGGNLQARFRALRLLHRRCDQEHGRR